MPLDKEIYIYDEHYETRMLNEDIARMIKSKGFAKERIIADCAEPKTNDDLRRLGITRLTAARKGKDSVRNGIAKIQEYKIYVHPDCVIYHCRAFLLCVGQDQRWRSCKQTCR